MVQFQEGRSGNPKGRPRGSPNKISGLLRDAILQAAEEAGGKEGVVGYLKAQAIEHPRAFMSLLGRVLPLQLSNDPEEPFIKEYDDRDVARVIYDILSRANIEREDVRIGDTG